MLLYHRKSKLFFHQLSDYKTVSVAQSKTKQKLAGLKTVGLGGVWETFEGRFFYALRAKKISKRFSKDIAASTLKSCMK